MVKRVVETDKTLENTNLSRNQSLIYTVRKTNANQVSIDWRIHNDDESIPFSKYQIKETDMRVKTASFTSPQYFDLTDGVRCILISTPQHENFVGVILNVEYDPKTGLYSYQCQDWSRQYMSKCNLAPNNRPVYDVLRALITLGNIGYSPSQEELKKWSFHLSGLRPALDYNEADWGSVVNVNPMTNTISMVAHGKTYMEVIRDLVYGQGRYIDIYFNDTGVIQFEPYHRDDFEKNGVHIDKRAVADVKPKFDTTNIITGVVVRNSSDAFDSGKRYDNDVLSAFFGTMRSTLDNIVESNTSSSTKSTSASTTSNPYGNKAKKIWINSDNGSGSFKNSVANLLSKNGWSVHNGRTCSNCHYEDYFNVTSDYQVYATVYNGFCAGTVREAYSSSIQNTLKKKGVVLVIMWDTHDWTNPQGMAPYKYGDFTGYNAGRAWDDNFSSGDPSIKNVASWLKSKDAKYCASPTPEGVVEQFLKGGYFASKGG